MRARVAWIAELTRNPGTGDFLRKFCGAIDCTLHAELARGKHEFCTISLRQEATLNAHGLRHDKNHAISENRAHHSESDAGIAGSRLNNGAASLQFSPGFRIPNHLKRNAVLDGAAGIPPFQLHPDFVFREQPRQTYDRRIADKIKHRGYFGML